jgi:histidine ammonia-lyase
MHRKVRTVSELLNGDRALEHDIEHVVALIVSGELDPIS